MPSSEARGLGRLAFKLLAAALVAGIVLGGLEAAARRAPTSFRQKRAGLEAAASEAQVLVLGPSVAINAIDPCAWAFPAYNLANNAQTLYYDKALLEAWSPRLPRLRTVVLGLSYTSLRCTVNSLNEQSRAFAYRQVFGIRAEAPGDRWDARNASALLTLGPLAVAHWLWDGQGLVLGDVGPCGHEELPTLAPDQQELQLSPLAGQQAAARHLRGMTEPAAVGLALLGGILADCAAQGRAAAVVLPPVTQAYAQSVDGALWAQDRDRVRALCAEHGAAYRDYFQDPRFNDADFSDVDHLAGPAARRFSGILAKDLKLPGSAGPLTARRS